MVHEASTTWNGGYEMRKIKFIYVACLILLGLVVPSTLLKASDENIGTIAWIEGDDWKCKIVAVV